MTVPAAWVDRVAYRPGWRFRLGGPGGTMLCCQALTADSLAPQRSRVTQHMWTVPVEVAGCERAFARWVFERLVDVERHEAGEWFCWHGLRPFWPAHGDGDPYEMRERWAE